MLTGAYDPSINMYVMHFIYANDSEALGKLRKNMSKVNAKTAEAVNKGKATPTVKWDNAASILQTMIAIRNIINHLKTSDVEASSDPVVRKVSRRLCCRNQRSPLAIDVTDRPWRSLIAIFVKSLLTTVCSYCLFLLPIEWRSLGDES